MIINALGDLSDPNLPDEPPSAVNPVGSTQPNGVTERVIRESLASGLTAVNVTLGYVAGAMEPFEYTVREIGAWDRIVRDHAEQLLKIHTSADIVRARAEKRLGIIFGFQNAAQVGQDPTRIDLFADLGVRVIQLTYNPRNQLGDGSAVAENRGITPLAREVIARLNARRVMLDLSHSGETTCLEAVRASLQPVSINHTGCRALADLPRNKTDAELRLVAERGGFVGIYFMPFLAPTGHAHAEDVVRHIAHAVDVCGEDHVGIGTDGAVTTIDDLDGYRARLAREVAARHQAGIGAAGERADTLPFVIDLRGVGQFRKLTRLLAAQGFTPARIEKILGGNFLRFARDVWGA
ncbi:MAG TPA: membrane dipeptidase [Opitutus sp.]|nr:membrane dipeptidase [Opitutus sp.]